MQAAPHLLSLLLILLQQSGWTQGLCDLENSTEARCDNLRDLESIETHYLEILQVPLMQDVLIPGFFNNLTNLEHLDLSGGHLKTIKSGSFRHLNNLKSLNLGENRIETLELASLEGLTHLRSLNLRKNAIRQLPPALMRLKNLKHLDVYGNPIECNCATLKVRDLVVQRGAILSKKLVCAGPGNMKGTSLMKLSATNVCNLEQQDREMQNDQAEEGSGIFEDEGTEEEDGSVEYEEVRNSEKSEEPEVETPFPSASVDSTTRSSTIELTASAKETTAAAQSTVGIATPQHTDTDEEIFFDNEDKKEQSTTEMSPKEEIKDALFYPTYGSGDEDEGSGEGSGAGVSAHYDEERTEKGNTNDDDLSITNRLWTLVFGGFGGEETTAATSEGKAPDLEDENFINVSSTEESSDHHHSHGVSTDATTASVSIFNNVEVLKPAGTDDKTGNVKVEVNSLNDEQTDVSPAKQPKKGMGSYIVLAILLAVVATLIGVAAYRGDICRKKRKRGDVENGTELKDMQKSLLTDTGNVTQSKITSNGNAESVPLVEGAPESDNAKVDKIQNENYQTQETPRSHNGTGDHQDPVKPPRRLISSQEDEKDEERPRVDVNSLRDNFFADRTSSPAQPSEPSNGPATYAPEPNGPPLSPGAQRVKITLQENPDSVPKTPILITRTTAGENLVKTP